jgi:hypothetical protein
MSSRDDEIIEALRHSPGDPVPADLYSRVASGVRRRHRRHVVMATAGLAACVVAAIAVLPVVLHGNPATNQLPSGQVSTVAAPPTCAPTLDDQPTDGASPGGSGLVPGGPSSAVLCEYDQIDSAQSLTRHAQLDVGQLTKMLAILRALKLTNAVPECPLQPTVDLLTFGYADGATATLRIGCAMVWRTDNFHAVLSDSVGTEVAAILENVTSPSPSSASPSSVALSSVAGGGVVLELDDAQHLAIVDLASGATTPLTLKGIPGGPSLIATNAAGGWVVTYTPDANPQWDDVSTRLALVDTAGNATPFGPTYPPSSPVTGLAVSPDGTRVAIALMQLDASAALASIVVSPMPGHSGPTQSWPVDDNDVNEMIDLSWAPDGKRLSYIVGIQTGGGIGGNPSVLDTSKPGKAPTQPTGPNSDCEAAGATWLGTTGRMAVVTDCAQAEYREADPTKGAAVGPIIQLPGHGCSAPILNSSSDASKTLVAWCGDLYLISRGTLIDVGQHVADAAWAG